MPEDWPEHANAVIDAELSDGFWTGLLPQQMDTSSSTSPYFNCYRAAQVKLGDTASSPATSPCAICC